MHMRRICVQGNWQHDVKEWIWSISIYMEVVDRVAHPSFENLYGKWCEIHGIKNKHSFIYSKRHEPAVYNIPRISYKAHIKFKHNLKQDYIWANNQTNLIQTLKSSCWKGKKPIYMIKKCKALALFAANIIYLKLDVLVNDIQSKSMRHKATHLQLYRGDDRPNR